VQAYTPVKSGPEKTGALFAAKADEILNEKIRLKIKRILLSFLNSR
jgi:hypothetical protein